MQQTAPDALLTPWGGYGLIRPWEPISISAQTPKGCKAAFYTGVPSDFDIKKPYLNLDERYWNMIRLKFVYLSNRGILDVTHHCAVYFY